MSEPTPWVLLRGLGREARHWGHFPAQLAAASGRPVLTPDLPGNGTRWREPAGLSIAAQCEALRAGLAAVLAQGPVDVLALSMGGMVALYWAQHYPAEVRSLVLINTSFAGVSPFWHRLRWQCYPLVLGLVCMPTIWREYGLLHLTSNQPQRRALAWPQWRACQRDQPVSLGNFLRQLTAAARFRPVGAWPGQPLTLLSSRQDRLVNPACTTRLAQRLSARSFVHPDAGHDLVLDDPAWVIACLDRHIHDS
ncbi:alpha/beta fold hydrolase [Chitinimonas sp. BJYL2]|uniref:alpha/beta fold hydrolase n=1 Tax=Chitinimonas sp. BJYL2 TaxID=2976696 RepID=UPI0022B562DC|nr:alpha/beta fold hydrolase [Chitinimonas sp. BJYL2]